MVSVTIGEIVGMSHETRYTKDGRPVLLHRPHRAIIAPVNGFHLAETGTFHVMRSYVVEYPDHGDFCQFVWHSYCGIYRLFVNADGECSEAYPHPEPEPYCHRCQTCQRLAHDEDVGLQAKAAYEHRRRQGVSV